MDIYSNTIRRTALGILDNTQSYNGGIFNFLSHQNDLWNNKSTENLLKNVLHHAKSSALSNGLLAALISTIILIILLIGLSIYTCIKNVNSLESARRRILSSKARNRAKDIGSRLPFSFHFLLTLFILVLVILAIIPLIIAFSTNSKLHSELTNSKHNLPSEFDQIYDSVDRFLENLIPQSRILSQPVVNQTLMKTHLMKVKSQKDYQDAFRIQIGATPMIAASTILLDSVTTYYNHGTNFTSKSDEIEYNSFKLDKNYRDYKSQNPQLCRQKLNESVCQLHSLIFNQTNDNIDRYFLETVQIRPNLKSVLEELQNLIGTLNGQKKTPDKMLKEKEEKEKVGDEFNKNITDVFDVELNSTKFVLDLVDDKFDKLDVKLGSLRGKLVDKRANISIKAGSKVSKYEGLRHTFTVIILTLILLTLISQVTISFYILITKQGRLNHHHNQKFIKFLATVYIIYAITLIPLYIYFLLTGYIRTDVCRYWYTENQYDKSIIDELLVPKINKLITKMKMEAGANDSIPIYSLQSIHKALHQTCQSNIPIMKSIGAVIDPNAGQDPSLSENFKLKGLMILRREMMNADLNVLRDPAMEQQMRDFKKVVSGFGTTEFGKLGVEFRGLNQTASSVDTSSTKLSSINTYVKQTINDNNDVYYHYATENVNLYQKNDEKLSVLFNFINEFDPILIDWEERKNISKVIDLVIKNAVIMDQYLANQTLWTETAAAFYKKYVVELSKNESDAISRFSSLGIMNSIVPCRDIGNIIDSLISVPCQVVLYPLSIIWFCIGWCLLFMFCLTFILHVQLTNRCDNTPSTRDMRDSTHIANSNGKPTGIPGSTTNQMELESVGVTLLDKS